MVKQDFSFSIELNEVPDTKESLLNTVEYNYNNYNSPLNHLVRVKDSAWDGHVINDHPERSYYDEEFNKKNILSILNRPLAIFDDKDFSQDFLRLNYVGMALIQNNGKLQAKPVKIITEALGDNILDYKDVSSWPKEDFVTAIVQSNMSDNFIDRRVHYVRSVDTGFKFEEQ